MFSAAVRAAQEDHADVALIDLAPRRRASEHRFGPRST
ncbi:Hypothetical protein A7982_02917 [Minicystis rosea]|nr:Hypothetical protein A7982_02917 [Minicystis rosea]